MSWLRLECYGKDTKALSYCTFVHYFRATRDDVIMHLDYIIWVTLLVHFSTIHGRKLRWRRNCIYNIRLQNISIISNWQNVNQHFLYNCFGFYNCSSSMLKFAASLHCRRMLRKMVTRFSYQATQLPSASWYLFPKCSSLFSNRRRRVQ